MCFVNKIQVRLWNKWKATTMTIAHKKKDSLKLMMKGWWNETNTKINNNFILLYSDWRTYLVWKLQPAKRDGTTENAWHRYILLRSMTNYNALWARHLRTEQSFNQKEPELFFIWFRLVSFRFFIFLLCIYNIKCLNLFSFCRIARHVT